jgi:hypothetical protein
MPWLKKLYYYVFCIKLNSYGEEILSEEINTPVNKYIILDFWN